MAPSMGVCVEKGLHRSKMSCRENLPHKRQEAERKQNMTGDAITQNNTHIVTFKYCLPPEIKTRHIKSPNYESVSRSIHCSSQSFIDPISPQ